MDGQRGIHKPTWIAIAVVAYALANLGHEGLGHGGVCLLVHGKPQILTSLHFGWDESSVGAGARRAVAAGGTLVNLVLGTAALLFLRAWKGGAHGRLFLWLFLWLFMATNLFQAAGYWMFSGIGNIGDWAEVVKGWHPAWAWHAGLAVAGGLAYAGAAKLAAEQLHPLLGTEHPISRARGLALAAYFAGGCLYCVSGLFNPEGLLLVLISGAAASFGGTSGLLWFHEFLRHRAPGPAPALDLPPHRGWMAAGLVTAALFMSMLGRGIRL
ncbi:MAG TPA: hypothetical protein VFF76_08630 [Holophagaceae bacterium]|jgi:hypothetical protein|nr:hypothetical protein [Holophagaceae bacterium]